MEQDRASLVLPYSRRTGAAGRSGHAEIIDLIAATTTTTGLELEAVFDTTVHGKGTKVSDAEMKRVPSRMEFYGHPTSKLVAVIVEAVLSTTDRGSNGIHDRTCPTWFCWSRTDGEHGVRSGVAGTYPGAKPKYPPLHDGCFFATP
jgi:hypothetical protein